MSPLAIIALLALALVLTRRGVLPDPMAGRFVSRTPAARDSRSTSTISPLVLEFMAQRPASPLDYDRLAAYYPTNWRPENRT